MSTTFVSKSIVRVAAFISFDVNLPKITKKKKEKFGLFYHPISYYSESRRLPFCLPKDMDHKMKLNIVDLND